MMTGIYLDYILQDFVAGTVAFTLGRFGECALHSAMAVLLLLSPCFLCGCVAFGTALRIWRKLNLSEDAYDEVDEENVQHAVVLPVFHG